MVLKPGDGQSLNHVHNYQTSFYTDFLSIFHLNVSKGEITATASS